MRALPILTAAAVLALNAACADTDTPLAPPATAPAMTIAQEVTRIFPTVDAPILIGFDEYDNQGNTYWCNIDPGNWFMSPTIRMAPTGRDDAWRPQAGMIEESRVAIEFDIESLVASNPDGVSAATLWLKFSKLVHYDGELLYDQVRMKVGGYAGDGTIDGLSEGPYAEGRRASFPAEYNPAPITWTASPITFTNATPGDGYIPIDVTDIVNTLIAAEESWAGFSLQLDFSSLPARATLPPDVDVTFGVEFYSMNTGEAPFLEIAETPEELVQALGASLAALQLAGALTGDQVDGLNDKLEAALASLDRGKPETASNQLRAFMNNVRSYVQDGYLTQEQGISLTARAQAVIAALNS